MNEHQKKSLALISSLLNTIDDEVFLQQYASFEKRIGPVATEFSINAPYTSFRKSLVETFCPEDFSKNSYKITIPRFEGKEQSYSANDDSYSECLAA